MYYELAALFIGSNRKCSGAKSSSRLDVTFFLLFLGADAFLMEFGPAIVPVEGLVTGAATFFFEENCSGCGISDSKSVALTGS